MVNNTIKFGQNLMAQIHQLSWDKKGRLHCTDEIADALTDGLKIRPNSFKVYNSKLIEKLNRLTGENLVVVQRLYDDKNYKEFCIIDGNNPFIIDDFQHYAYRIKLNERSIWSTYFSIASLNKWVNSSIKFEENK